MGLASVGGLLKSSFVSRQKDAVGKSEMNKYARNIKPAVLIRDLKLNDFLFIFNFSPYQNQFFYSWLISPAI